MNRENPKVDFYFSKAKNWKEELAQLRSMILECELIEELKWGTPCYTCPIESRGKTTHKSNIVLIHVFKEYCALLFFKGALLKDAKGVLVQQTENVQAARQMRFTNVRDITKLKTVIQRYVYEAIEVEEAGLKVTLKKTTELKMPEEFQKKLAKTPALKTSFSALTPGRQRGYLLYFSAAKQSATRASRIEKSMKNILNGKGLND